MICKTQSREFKLANIGLSCSFGWISLLSNMSPRNMEATYPLLLMFICFMFLVTFSVQVSSLDPISPDDPWGFFNSIFFYCLSIHLVYNLSRILKFSILTSNSNNLLLNNVSMFKKFTQKFRFSSNWFNNDTPLYLIITRLKDW